MAAAAAAVAPRDPSDNLYVSDLPADFDEAQLQTIFGAYGTITQSKLLFAAPGTRKSAKVRFATVEEAQWIVENLHGNIPQGLTEPIQVMFAETREQAAARQASAVYGKAGGKGALAGSLLRPSPYGAVGTVGKGTSKGGLALGKGTLLTAAPRVATLLAPAATYAPKGVGKGGCTIKTLFQGLLAANGLPGGATHVPVENSLYISNLPADTTDLDLYKIFGTFGAISATGVRAMLHPDGSCRGFGFVNYLDTASADLAIQTLNGTIMPDGKTLSVQLKNNAKAATETV